ncbi:MAG: hypothetical protein AAFY88_30895, partial [Acidobacteriota bacterium]
MGGTDVGLNEELSGPEMQKLGTRKIRAPQDSGRDTGDAEIRRHRLPVELSVASGGAVVETAVRTVG